MLPGPQGRWEPLASLFRAQMIICAATKHHQGQKPGLGETMWAPKWLCKSRVMATPCLKRAGCQCLFWPLTPGSARMQLGASATEQLRVPSSAPQGSLTFVVVDQ
jgi:hypothetical protein